MITCNECGHVYNDNMKKCPKCGNPTELSMSGNICPNCGAEAQKVEGYNFVCEFCDTQFPVDPQTRAKIDAQQRQIYIAKLQEHNAIVAEKNKKTLKKIGIIVLCLMAAITGYNWYSKYKEKSERAEADRERAEAQAEYQAEYDKIVQDIEKGNAQSAYVSPSDIFVTDNSDRIGHLNQNLISILKQKGFVEDGTLTYSYYVNGKKDSQKKSDAHPYGYDNYGFDPSKPLITIEINSYSSRSYSKSERHNETDDVHSIAISIYNNDLKKAYENNFRKDLRDIGFNSEVENKHSYNGSSAMTDFDLIRIGNSISKTEYYITKITANWEGVKFGYVDEKIECVGFCELDDNVSEQVDTKTKTTERRATTIDYSNDGSAEDAVAAAEAAVVDALKK